MTAEIFHFLRKGSHVSGKASAFGSSPHPPALPDRHRALLCIIALVLSHGNIFTSSDSWQSDPALSSSLAAGKAIIFLQLVETL